jgi:hypothetical protein
VTAAVWTGAEECSGRYVAQTALVVWLPTRRGQLGLPMTGGLLHFPVLLMAAPVEDPARITSRRWGWDARLRAWLPASGVRRC